MDGGGGGGGDGVLNIDYDEQKELCKQFLRDYSAPGEVRKKYMRCLLAVANRDERNIEIEVDDVKQSEQHELAERISTNAHRYRGIFEDAIAELLENEVEPTEDLSAKEDVIDILLQNYAERQARQEDLGGLGEDGEGANDNNPTNNNIADKIPPALIRRFEVRLLPSKDVLPVAAREIRAIHIGQLVRVTGMVIRVTDVKPRLTVATYTCEGCASEVYQAVGAVADHFNPLQKCPIKQCNERGANGRLIMQTRGSKFVKYQELKLQELPDQVPVGHIPRTMTVHCTGEVTRRCTQGDIVTIAGVFLPKRKTGFQAIKAGLIGDSYLEAMSITRDKVAFTEMEKSDEVIKELTSMSKHRNIYNNLARSIAPEIYGHLDVKKALLLQLVGGVTKSQADGLKIRGDINLILMGDPGVAKSQLIKYIARVAPRGVYTTGKGSSGVGLTAAVVKDSVTNELTLEGGALVMADKGICCIDEFDKMDEGDRTAIHEVMEQQTVSIAKAGITTTLNARCSVLAAANPLYGRYNKKKSMSVNINLPNSLLSRFDLVFLIIDKAVEETDRTLARHVGYVHANLECPPQAEPDVMDDDDDTDTEERLYDMATIKRYVSEARTYDPYISKGLGTRVVDKYVELRQQDASKREGGQDHESYSSTTSRMIHDQTMMTARQLLSILRLSQALARIRFSDQVEEGDLDEAIRLTEASKASIFEDDEDAARVREDVYSRIFEIIKRMANREDDDVKCVAYKTVEETVVKQGIPVDDLTACLKYYQALTLLSVVDNGTNILLHC